MFGRRGQGAMEYLMTYGWAILVVMIVGIVMWELGIFNMGSTSMTSSGFGKIKPQIAASGLNADDSFTGVFTNGVGTRITLVQSTATLDNADTCTLTAVPTTPSAGDNFKLSGTGCDSGGIYTSHPRASFRA